MTVLGDLKGEHGAELLEGILKLLDSETLGDILDEDISSLINVGLVATHPDSVLHDT